jgi:hypothetical protein
MGGPPAVDVTDKTVQEWARAKGEEPAKFTKSARIQSAEQKEGDVDLHFIFWTTKRWSESTIRLSWEHIFKIVEAVKKEGAIHKDRAVRTEYIR